MQNDIENEAELVVKDFPNIVSVETIQQAHSLGLYRLNVRNVRARIADFFKPDIKKADELHKSLLAKMKQVDSKPAQIEQTINTLLADWQTREAERVRQEQAEADERARREAVKSAKAEGDKQLAKQIEKGTVAVASVAVAQSQKIAGVTMRESWSAEVVDIVALCRAVADDIAPKEYVSANIPALNSIMRSTKGQMRIDGVKAVKTASIVSTR